MSPLADQRARAQVELDMLPDDPVFDPTQLRLQALLRTFDRRQAALGQAAGVAAKCRT